MASITVIIIWLMTRITCGRYLLLKVHVKNINNYSNYININILPVFTMLKYVILQYPSLFTHGFISHESPDPKALEQVYFSFMFKALGWTEKLAEPTDKHTDLPNKKVITKVTANCPYNITAISLLWSAITILKEADKILVK